MDRTVPQALASDPLGSLLARYQETGEDRAIDELVARTRPRLLAIARRIAGATGAEDAVQAAYLALVSQKRPAAEVRVAAWLTAATIRRAYRLRALERRQVELAEKLGSPAAVGDPSLIASRREQGATVAGEVERLPARYRDPIVLHHLQGLTAGEVATLLDLPRGTVLSRLRRGRALLEPRLASRCAYALTVLPVVFLDLARSAVLPGGAVVKTKTTTTIAAVLVALLLGGGIWVAVQSAQAPRHLRTAPGVDAGEDGVGGDIAGGQEEGGAGEDDVGVGDAGEGDEGAGGDAAAASARPVATAAVPVAASEEDETPGLSGRVVDTAGQPIAGAKVFAFAMPDGKYSGELREQGAQTVSAGDGSFAFDPGEEETCGVYAEAAGFATRGKSWLVVPATSQAVEVVLAPVARVGGRVVDSDGHPLAAATVSMRRPERMSPTMREWRRLQTSAETAADGSYALERLPPGEVELAASHRDAAEESLVLTLAVGEHLVGIDFELGEGFSITGVVVDDRGAPIAGAEVKTGTRESPRSAMSDDEGKFRMRGLGAGEVRLTATHAGHGFTAGGYPQGVAAQPGDEGVRIVLFRAVRVTGLVRDSEGSLVEGAIVKAGPALRGSEWATSSGWSGSGEVYWTRAGADGAFELEGLPPGQLDALAIHQDHEPSEFVTLSVALGDDPEPIELVLAAGLQISGRVQDEDGNPVAGVSVWMSSTETSPLSRHSSGFGPAGTSGEDGRFTVGGLSPTGVYCFEARRDGWISPGSRELQISPGTTDVVITVRKGGVISGHLVAPDGTRRGGQVSLDEVTETRGWGGGNVRTFGAQEHASAEDGFTFDGVPAGTYTLAAERDGDFLVQPQTIELADGERREGIELAYVPGKSIGGRVVNEDGDPVPGMTLTLMMRDSSSLRARLPTGATADDGTFSLAPVLDGEYWISPFPLPAGYMRPEPWEASAGDFVELMLSRGITLAGRVLLPTGAPATSMQIRATAEGAPPLPVGGVTTADGRFELAGVDPHSTLLVIQVAGCAHLELTLAGLPGSGRHDLGDIQLSEGAALAVTVVDAGGNTVGGATLMVLDPVRGRSKEPLGTGTTDEGGGASFEHLSPGAATIMVDAADSGTTTAGVTLEDGATAEARVEMPPTVVLTGRVVEADGSPRAGIHVQTQQQPEAGENVTVLQFRETVTAPDGTYRIAGMVAGRHNVSANPAGRYTKAAASQTIVITPSTDATCDLSLTE